MRTPLRCFFVLMLCALPALVQAQFNFTTNGSGDITLVQYTGPGGAVTIPNTTNGHPVTTVASSCFFQVAALTSVTFGVNVTTLGDNAIFQCPNLTTVTLPPGVTNIGAGPIIDCIALTTMTLAATNTHYAISGGALYNKTLTSLIENPGAGTGTFNVSAIITNVGEAFIGNSLTAITVNPANTFFDSTNGVLCDKFHSALWSFPGALVTNYTVPATFTLIVGAAFEYATGVTSVTIGTNINSIQGFAFYDCTNLIAITVNTTNAFYSSTNGVLFDKAKTLLIQYPSGLPGTYVIPNTVTNISDGAFGDAINLTSVVIPDSVTRIGQQTFYNCPNLANASLGNHILYIGQQAFIYCTNLTEIVIPNSVTNIDASAFFLCSQLRSLTVGSGVKSIGFEAFGGCQLLTNACFEGNQPVDGGSIFFFDTALTQILFVSGTTGWGPTYDGITTAPCLACSVSAPTLGILQAGSNVLLGWPTTFTGFTLQSNASLTTSAGWGTVVPAPAVVGSINVVTNPIRTGALYYRLRKP